MFEEIGCEIAKIRRFSPLHKIAYGPGERTKFLFCGVIAESTKHLREDNGTAVFCWIKRSFLAKHHVPIKWSNRFRVVSPYPALTFFRFLARRQNALNFSNRH